MYKSLKRSSASSAESRLLGVVAAVFVVAALYFARVVFVPLALAVLLSVVLTPPVTLLERIRLPRILSIFMVVVILVGLLGLLGWKVSGQVVDLTDQLPSYGKILDQKIRSLGGSGTQTFTKASDTVKELSQEIGAVAPGATPAPDASAARRTASQAPGSSTARPMAVEVVPPTNPLESVENLLGPLATAGIVIVFTVFILAGREDLRNRLIRLAGGGRINRMTQALDDASQRITRYLFLQLLVNVCYGLIIFTALHFLGIPDAPLWGVCASIFRFLPYVGPPMAGLMPVVMALAVFPGWDHALETFGVYVVLEVVVSNFVEPLLYGAHVGLSGLAILVAAVFWTLIWGFPGLVLSTPLTVCLVVMGRYVPSMGFLNVLLGDEPGLSPHAQYYQRLLATDSQEARRVADQYLKEKDKTLEDLYGTVLIPALALAQQDRHRDELDDDKQTFICQTTREMVDELAKAAAAHRATNGSAAGGNGATGGERARRESALQDAGNGVSGRQESAPLDVLCIPARDDADDLIATLLCDVLEQRGQHAQSIPPGAIADMLAQVAQLNPKIVCVSALPPFALNHARGLFGKLRAQSPDLDIVLCLWQFDGDTQDASMRMKLTGAHALLTTLPEVVEHVVSRTKKTASGSSQAEPVAV